VVPYVLPDNISEAALTAAAGKFDVVIFAGGIYSGLESEERDTRLPGFLGGDRTQIELPAVQTKALKALKASGKPVVLVICSGSAQAIPWEAENLDAILMVWYGGQSGGTAVADVLFGKYNPGGRLPFTVYKATTELPEFTNYDMHAAPGRTYRYYKGKALYPFGFGLSYTQFQYEKPALEGKGENLKLAFSLSNIGGRAGDDVPQVYVKYPGKPDEPIKALKGFTRVKLAAQGSVKVEIPLPPRTFETYVDASDSLEVLPGKYQVCLGPSSAEETLYCGSDLIVTI
jgi:beta-glucosidase